ncbi:MAG: hypothetical protein ABGZ53_31615 [Fuerstiella sp.]
MDRPVSCRAIIEVDFQIHAEYGRKLEKSDDDSRSIIMGDGDEVFHVFFRGESTRLDATAEIVADVVEGYIWAAGVGETDRDPLFVFLDYDLSASYRLAHVSRGYDEDAGKVVEYRVFNVFDEKGVLIEPITLERVRDVEEGEFGT